MAENLGEEGLNYTSYISQDHSVITQEHRKQLALLRVNVPKITELSKWVWHPQAAHKNHVV